MRSRDWNWVGQLKTADVHIAVVGAIPAGDDVVVDDAPVVVVAAASYFESKN